MVEREWEMDRLPLDPFPTASINRAKGEFDEFPMIYTPPASSSSSSSASTSTIGQQSPFPPSWQQMEVPLQNVVYCDFTHDFWKENNGFFHADYMPRFGTPSSMSPESQHNQSSSHNLALTSSSQEGQTSNRSSPDQIDLKPEVSLLNFNQLPKNVCPTMCVVCGDAAAGYHYDVPSCNGCKTFFRRTVLDQRKFVCKKGGKCFETLPKEKRCSCRACRFTRCVEVGMNPMAIQTDKDLKGNEMFKTIVSKRKIEEAVDVIEEPPTDSRILMDIRLKENAYDRMIDSLVYLEIKVDKLRSSTYNPRPFEIGTLREVLEKHSALSLADKLEPMPNWPLPPMPAHNPDEFCQMRNPSRKRWMLFDLLVAVEYAKTFDFFFQLDSQDKYILTRYVSLMCMQATQCFYSYLLDADTIVHPDGTKPLDMWKWKKNLSQPATSHTSTADTRMTIFEDNVKRMKKMRMCKEEYVLLKAILLCNPALSDLSEHGSKIIGEAKAKYAEALFQMEMAKYGATNGPTRFQSILAYAELLIRNAQKHREFHLVHVVMNSNRSQHRSPWRSALIQDCMDA